MKRKAALVIVVEILFVFHEKIVMESTTFFSAISAERKGTPKLFVNNYFSCIRIIF
jgi:hypothetical protein